MQKLSPIKKKNNLGRSKTVIYQEKGTKRFWFMYLGYNPLLLFILIRLQNIYVYIYIIDMTTLVIINMEPFYNYADNENCVKSKMLI